MYLKLSPAVAWHSEHNSDTYILVSIFPNVEN